MNKFRYIVRVISAVSAIILMTSCFNCVLAENESIFEDKMEDLSKIYDCEGTFLVKNDLEHPEDQYRIYKSSVEKQSITYKTEQAISGFEIKTYSTQQNIEKIAEVYLSADGDNWEKTDFISEVEPGYTDAWNWSYLTQKRHITNTYYYLKIVVGDNKNTWNPQISNVVIFMNGLTSRPYVPETPDPLPNPSYAEYKNKEAASIVFGNNILEPGKSQPEIVLTRGEFARALLELSGLNTDNLTADINGDIVDVNKNTQYADAIYVAVFYKIMDCFSDRTFEGDSAVTYIQAIRGTVRALGYGIDLENDEDYISKAIRLGLLKGITYGDNDEKLSREQAVMLLYNALKTPPVLWNGSARYSKSNTNVLEGQKKIQKRKGQVTATSYGSLSSNDVTNDGYTEIDGVLYKTQDVSINSFLGYGVCYYINEENEIIAYSLLDKGAEPITISPENMLTSKSDYNNGKIVYDNGEAKEKTVKFNFDFMAFNGFRTDISYETLIGPDIYVTLYDSDEDRIYDTALIEKYSYIIVKSVNAQKEVIQGIYGEVLDLSGVDKAILYRAGERVDISEVKVGNTLSVLESRNGKYVRAYIRTVKLKGKVTSIFDDEIIIQDGSYIMARSFSDMCANGLAQYPNLGMEGTFYLGRNYEIIGFTANIAAKQYAYMYSGGWSDDISDTAWFKLYTDDGRFIKCESSENMRVKINGSTQRIKQSDFNTIFCPGGTFEECVVLVDFNNDGSVKRIDKDVRLDVETTVGSFNGGKILCGSYPITSDTKFFSIPEDRKDYECYGIQMDLVEGDTRPNSSDVKYHMRFYELNDMNSPEVVVVYQSDKDDSKQTVITKAPTIVNEIRQVYDEQENEVKTKLFLGVDNQERGFEISDNVSMENMQPGQSSFTDLTRGDIILYATNVRGQIVRIFVLYHSDGKAFISADGLTQNFGENISINPDYPIAYGTVKNFGSGFLIADTGEKITAVSTSTSTRYYIIDMGGRKGKIERVTKDDIRFGDIVLLKTMRFGASDIFILRD